MNPINDMSLGVKIQSEDTAYCSNISCCITKKEIICVQSPKGEELEITSDTILIAHTDDDTEQSTIFRPKKTFEAIVNQDRTFKRTVSKFYSFLCTKYDPTFIAVAAISRGVDFVKLYNKSRPLRIKDINLLKIAIQGLFPIKKTLTWVVEKIHECADYMTQEDFLINTQFMQRQLQSPPMKSMENISHPSTQKTYLIKNEKEAQKKLFFEIVLARGILDTPEAPLISSKIKSLFIAQKPKTLEALTTKGKIGYLRPGDADKIIYATRVIHRLFEKYLPKFIQEENYLPSSHD